MSAEPSKKQALVVGCLVLALGLGSAAAIHFHPQALRVPAWVAYVAVSTFALAGVALIAGAMGGKRLAQWLGVLIACALTIPPLWIAFGPGSRDCSFSFGFLSGAAPELACRGAFGAGALLFLVFLGLFLSRG